VLRAMPDKSVDHVITDPPYSARTHAGFGAEGRSDGFKPREALAFPPMTALFATELAEQFERVCRRWVVCFGDEATMGYWLECGLPWVRAGFWVKTDGMPQMSGDRPANGADTISIMHVTRPAKSGRIRWNGGGKAAIWLRGVQRADRHQGRNHPTPKPIDLMMDLVSDFTDPGDVILDPFCGGGSSGVAALRLGRSFIGIEQDPEHVDTSRARLTAESRGLTLQAARAGQISIFDSLGGGLR